jgi:beta-aspartyl-peptidase (threonine type)
MAEHKYTLLIHGGVGTILKENMSAGKEAAYQNVLTLSLNEGEKVLKERGSAIEAVEAAIKVMKASVLFNAGRASVFTIEMY